MNILAVRPVTATWLLATTTTTTTIIIIIVYKNVIHNTRNGAARFSTCLQNE